MRKKPFDRLTPCLSLRQVPVGLHSPVSYDMLVHKWDIQLMDQGHYLRSITHISSMCVQPHTDCWF